MKNHKLVIFGNGHMARMMAEFLAVDHEIAAFTVDRAVMDSEDMLGRPLVAFDEIERHFAPDQHRMLIAVGFVEMNRIRAERYAQAKAKGYGFINYIDSTVKWHSSNQIGENNIILEYVSIHPFSRLGNSNFISSNCNFGHGCQVGDNCWFNAGVSIGGETEIRDNSVFGINASASNGICVAPKTFVGANTFLNKSTEEGAVYLSEAGTRFRLGSESFLKFMKVL